MFGVSPTQRELPGLTRPGAHWSACGLGHSTCCFCSCWCRTDAQSDPVERSEGVSPPGSRPGAAMSQAGGKVDTGALRLGRRPGSEGEGRAASRGADPSPHNVGPAMTGAPHTEAAFQPPYTLPSVSRTGPHGAHTTFLSSNPSSLPFTPERPAFLRQSIGKRRLDPEEALGGRGGPHTSGFTAVISKLSASRAKWLDGLSYSLCWFLLGGGFPHPLKVQVLH